MPKALVEVRRAYAPDEEVAIMNAVHDALIAAFKIPPQDRTVRLITHEAHRFSCSPELSNPDRYTLVSIDCFAGRTLDAKRRLYREVVERLATRGIPHDHITVVLHEVALENWGIDGGHPASDVDLGFTVQV